MSTHTAVVTALDPASFSEFIANQAAPVVVDFWAPWCGPCRSLAPHLEKVAQRFDGQVQIHKVNVDEAQDLASHYRVRGVPTLILFKDGKPQSQLVGLHSEAQVSEWVNQSL